MNCKSKREQIKMLQEANNSLDEVGKKRRKNSIPQIEFIQQLMSTYGEKIGHNEESYKNMLKSMVENSESQPICELLQCAASNYKNTIVKQEQLLNQIKEQRKSLKQWEGNKEVPVQQPRRKKDDAGPCYRVQKKGPADSLMISKTNMWKQLLNTKADSSSLITDQKTLDLLKRTRTSVDRFLIL